MKPFMQRKRIVRIAGMLSVLALLLIVTFYHVLFGPWKMSFSNMNYAFAPFDSEGVATKGPSLSDVANNVLPIAAETYQGFHFTSWLANAGIGSPQLMSMYLSPLNYLYLLPMGVAIPLIAMVKITVAFLGMVAFVRQLGYGWKGAIFAGLSYCASSVMVVWLGWPHSEVMMYGPVLFVLLDKAVHSPKVRYFVGIVAVVYLMMVAGMPTYAAYFLYLGGCYVLYAGVRTYGRHWKSFTVCAGSAFVAVVLGGVASLPYTGELLGSVGSNGYSESRADQATWSLPIGQIKSLFFPYLSTRSDYHFNEITLYTGILVMVSLPLIMVHWRRKNSLIFFAVASVVLLSLIFTDLLNPVFTHLPLINTSKKYRVIVLLNFVLSVIVGINMDDLFAGVFDSFADKIKILLASGCGVLGYCFILWRIWPTIPSADSGRWQPYVAGVVVVLFTIAVIVRVCGAGRMLSSVCAVALFAGVAVDMGYFAANYMPLIEKSASVIPAATDSVQYLQRNTKQQEKIATVGDWTFFPLTNMFYGIRNIFGHGFVYTNPDVVAYYRRIDSTMYKSKTRPALNKVQNENLLRYLGVKYVVSDADETQDRIPVQGTPTPVELRGNAAGSTLIRQDFISANNGLDGIRVLVGTGGTQYAAGSTLTAAIRDASTGRMLRESSIPLSKLRDNAWAYFTFDALDDSAGVRYLLTLSVRSVSNESLFIYTSSQENYDGNGSLESNGRTDLIRDVAFSAYYTDDGHIGADGLLIRQIDNYNAQVQLTDTVQVESTDSDVLDSMAARYQPNTVFLNMENGMPPDAKSTKQSPLEANEMVTDIRHGDDGSITFDVSVNTERYVVVNEYNDGNWTATVDGEQTKVYRGNAIFRTILVPAGHHTVTLSYNSPLLNRLFAASLISWTTVLFVVAFRKPLDRLLTTIGSK